jgi:hypothetical protein
VQQAKWLFLTALDVNHNGTLVAKFNNTTSANSLIAFENAGNEQWWIGTENTNNDFLFYDATNFPTLSLRTTFKTNGQVLIGGGSTGSGKLVVESATSDNGIQIVGANAPSLRIDSAATGPTKRIGLGISTGVNNFIQGSADRDMCIFNGSTTASPMLFGIYDTTNVQEAARISPARNFLIGTTTDNGSKLNVNGVINAAGRINSGSGGGATASLNAQQLSSDDAAIYAGGVVTTGSSKGIKVLAGTNSSDYALYVASYANSPILYARGDGNIGIGTFSPSEKLDVRGGALFNGDVRLDLGDLNVPKTLYFNANSTTGASYGNIKWYNVQWDGNTRGELLVEGDGALANGRMVFKTGSSGSNATEKMRLTNGGNLLIGTTTDAGQKLQVNGNVKIPVGNTYNNGSNAIKSADSVVVSTSPTTIYTSQQVGSVESGNLVLVTGVLSGTGSNFVDLVLFITNGSAIVVQQQSISSPAARTYAVSGTSLTLTMASGNYVVGTGGFIQGYNLSF